MIKIEYLGRDLLIEEVEERIFVIGDLHIGVEEVLEKSGVLIGRRLFAEMIEELGEVFEKTGKVNEIVLLGDLKHDFSELTMQERQELNKLFDYLLLHCKKIVIIRGNHDNYLLNLTSMKGIEIRDYYLKGGIAFLHGDRDFSEIYDKKIKCWVMGHLHPAVKIAEKEGAKIEKYKCFLEGKFKGKKIIIVPSFSSFGEGSDARESGTEVAWKFNFKKFKVKVVADDLKVLDFGELGRIRKI